jgi:hypothetical protein
MLATGFACSCYLQTLNGDISISGKSVHQDILSRYYDGVIACIRD